MYKILLCTTNYETVILVTPPGGKPKTPGVRCFCRSRNISGDKPVNIFYGISVDEAKSHFAAYLERKDIATPPEVVFTSVDEAEKFIVDQILTRELEAELIHRDIELHNI